MFEIRNYKSSDYKMIKEWWIAVNQMAPLPSMMLEESSFIIELNKTPAVSITAYLTNSKQLCWLDNLIGNPKIDKKERMKATRLLFKHAENFAKNLGYRTTFCFSQKPKIINYCKRLGYTPTLKAVTTLVKEI